jgi:hypothetical protein
VPVGRVEREPVVKYIVPATTIGPACIADTSGSTYVHATRSCATLLRSIWESGENRSAASVRLYKGQSAAATFRAGAVASGAGAGSVSPQPTKTRAQQAGVIPRPRQRRGFMDELRE